MKILVLGSRIPFPLHDGGAIATYNMLKEMAVQGCDITYFSCNTKKHFVTQKVIDDQFHFCKVIHCYLDAEIKWYKAIWNLIAGKNYNITRFESADANSKLAEFLNSNEFDVVHFEGLYSVPFLNTVLNSKSNAVKVLRQHNVEYSIWEKLSLGTNNPIKRWYLNHLAQGLKNYEIEAICNFQHILAIAETDADVFREINPKADVFYYPAGIEVSNQSTEQPMNISLYHIGSMEWLPNKEGVKWFIDLIFPEIIKMHPTVKLHLAGKGLNASDAVFSGDNIVNHGEVKDALEFHKKYSIMVVPLFSGSGLRMKLIEAMLLSKPVVSTTIGAAGIDYSAGVNVFIADSKEEWIICLNDLLGNVKLRTEMGNAAKQLIVRDFSNSEQTKKLLIFYRSILNHTS